MINNKNMMDSVTYQSVPRNMKTLSTESKIEVASEFLQKILATSTGQVNTEIDEGPIDMPEEMPAEQE